ncbi:hypothetical protein [Streptomyces bobili]
MSDMAEPRGLRDVHGRYRNHPGPVPGQPLRLFPGVGEHRGDDGVLRRYLDPGGTLFQAPTARKAVNTFVRKHAEDLATGGTDLREIRADQDEGALNVHIQQFHQDLPVLGAALQVVADTRQAAVVQVENTTEADVSGAPDVSTAKDPGSIEKAALTPFRKAYDSAAVVRDELVYLRDTSRPPLPKADSPTASLALLRKGKRRPDGRLHLVHNLVVETTGPFEHFRVVVDAVTARLLWIELAGKYVTATLSVYRPDPVTESNDSALSFATTHEKLKKYAHEEQAEIAPADAEGNFQLEGVWCRCRNWDDPAFPQPKQTSTHFVFPTHPEDKAFLSANAYYWIDRFARYLRGLNETLKSQMVQVEVDPQGAEGTGRSEWIGTTTPPRIRFDTTDVPGAADLGVIVHEYMHGVVQWLLSPGRTGPLEYEHSICDAVAGIYKDQFNLAGHRRTDTFPFHNEEWNKQRRLDLTQRFDAADFNSYSPDVRNSMLASALWRCYLGMGGSSKDPYLREKAAEKMIRTLLAAIQRLAADNSQSKQNAVHLAEMCIAADATVNTGIHKNMLYNAFAGQGLWGKPNVDVYIADRPGDTGVVSSDGSTEPFWTSPDIWVRNEVDGDDPEAGPQVPIVGKPNYVYVRVHNRGTADAEAESFMVDVRRCRPGTGMVWPDDFEYLTDTAPTTQMIHQPIPPGGAVRVGPLDWVPKYEGHECLIAFVHGPDDPTIAATPTPTPHDRLVRFDNNVGQLNLHPLASIPGGQTKVPFMLRGAPKTTKGAWRLNASSLPEDTQITIRTLKRIVEPSTLSHIRVTEMGSPEDKRCTLQMTGGVIGALDGFTLDARDEAMVNVTIDFSHEAEHLEKYRFVSTQIQDHEVAGRMTIEITAVKDFDEFFFGNPKSGELHISTCPLWGRIGKANKVPFPRIEEAIQNGYNGCAFCLPEANTG